MKIISPRLHGMLDYIVGFFLCIAPWVLGFSEQPVARWTFIAMGLMAIGYSLVTEYELGLPYYRALPMTYHLGLDLVSAVVLIASPWMFGYSEEVMWPPVIIGLLEIAVVLMTPWRRVAVDRRWGGRTLGTT